MGSKLRQELHPEDIVEFSSLGPIKDLTQSNGEYEEAGSREVLLQRPPTQGIVEHGFSFAPAMHSALDFTGTRKYNITKAPLKENLASDKPNPISSQHSKFASIP
jgi:hypothetical protein